MRKPPAWHGQAWALKAVDPSASYREIALKCGVSPSAIHYLFEPRVKAEQARQARHRRHNERLRKMSKTDMSSRLGAEKLAQELKAHWRERGYEIEAVAQEMPFLPTMRSRRWEVRTNMINGAPIGYKVRQAA